MKKILSMAVLLSALIMGTNSCSREESLHEKTSGNSITLQLNGAVRTYASPTTSSPSSIAALDREKHINTAHVVLFKKDGNTYKYFGIFDGKLLNGFKYKFDVSEAGTFKMIVAVNIDGDLRAKIESLEKGVSEFDAFGKLVAGQSPGENNSATGFLMLSDLSKEVITSTNAPTDAGTINVKRAAARFDVLNKVSGLSMTKLTFKQRVTSTRLATGQDVGDLTVTDTKTYGSSEGLSANECVAAIYSYEHPTSGQCKLVLEGTYNGKAINPYEIVINTEVKRNHLYSIVISQDGNDVNPGDGTPKLKANIRVRDWNEPEVIEWNGDKLTDRSMPDFSVSGTGVTTVPAETSGTPQINPKEIKVGSDASSITITSISVSAGSKLESTSSGLAAIQPGTTEYKDGKLHQTFTVDLSENAEKQRTITLVLSNAFAPSASREIVLKQRGKKDRNVKLSIDYVAEYNVSSTPGKFTDNNNLDGSGYYTWYQARTACPPGYHLPTKEEWSGIIPLERYVKYFSSSYYNVAEDNIQVGQTTGNYKADYKTVNGICYAVRFKNAGNEMLSAWRYQWDGNCLKIKVRYLGSSSVITIEEISSEEWWNNGNYEDIERIFPACGYINSGDYVSEHGSEGRYWSASPHYSSYSSCIYFSSTNAYVDSNGYRQSIRYSVRPFSDK